MIHKQSRQAQKFASRMLLLDTGKQSYFLLTMVLTPHINYLICYSSQISEHWQRNRWLPEVHILITHNDYRELFLYSLLISSQYMLHFLQIITLILMILHHIWLISLKVMIAYTLGAMPIEPCPMLFDQCHIHYGKLFTSNYTKHKIINISLFLSFQTHHWQLHKRNTHSSYLA